MVWILAAKSETGTDTAVYFAFFFVQHVKKRKMKKKKRGKVYYDRLIDIISSK